MKILFFIVLEVCEVSYDKLKDSFLLNINFIYARRLMKRKSEDQSIRHGGPGLTFSSSAEETLDFQLLRLCPIETPGIFLR